MKLNKEKLENKQKYHEKRVDYYKKKVEDCEKEKKQAGFKWY